jgi:hypothetical protein
MRRRQRYRQKIQAFFISFLVACGIVFVFDDGPEHGKTFQSLTQAGSTVANLWNQASERVQTQNGSMGSVLPAGFHPVWLEQSLDQGKIHLKVLKQPYAIGQTEGGLGREYFSYAALTFNQIADQVKSPVLADRLRILSTQASGIGNALREASLLGYNGPPTSGMDHLRARENLLALVKSFGGGNTLTVAYNEKGQVLERKQASMAASGESLKAFLDNSRDILTSPDANQYPETLQVVRLQSQWLEKVATNVTLRWDSIRYCPDSCTGLATHVRVYAQQRLSQEEMPKLLMASF